MVIGIVGLGLIGGSMAKAVKTKTAHRVLGFDLDETVMEAALSDGSIDARLAEENISDCDFLLIALYPAAAVRYVEEMRGLIGKKTVVMDLCGVKTAVCVPMTKLAEASAFQYIGAHPMAGTEKVGYRNARGDLFEGASMILVPCKNGAAALAAAEALSLSLGFAKMVCATMEEHDRIIAFTSQLAHVVSNAYVKSPTALLHHGFSAGSYKDLTRVAWLNETMWTELFLDNADALLEEIEGIRAELSRYADCIRTCDRNGLKALLRDGRERKEHIDRQ